MPASCLKQFVQLMVQQLTGMTPAPFLDHTTYNAYSVANKNKHANNADCVTSLRKWCLQCATLHLSTFPPISRRTPLFSQNPTMLS